MARPNSNCVLCGKELARVDRVPLAVFETKQTACVECKKKFQEAMPMEQVELCRKILQSPDLAFREDVEAYQKSVAGKDCPACGHPMDRKQKNMSIGADGYGGLTSLGLPEYRVDLYACPKCGKVELYTARFQSSEE